MGAPQLLETLRAQIGLIEGYREREQFPFSALESGGIPKGALVEMTGAGKTELVVQFLSENPSLRVAWIEENFSIYPCAFLQRHVSLNRILFADAGSEAVWAALQAIRSQLFDVVVLHSSTPTAQDSRERVLRRFQIAAEKARAGVILLSDFPQRAWPISLQLQVRRSHWSEVPNVSVLKRRG